jgi:hypothetical protein
MAGRKDRPPMRQYLLVTPPGGRAFRWGEDDRDPQGCLIDLEDSDTAPGGHAELRATVPLGNPGRSKVEPRMPMGSKVELFSATHDRLWQGRLTRPGQSSVTSRTLTSVAVGYQAHLTDDESVQCIPIDQDMTAWGSPSTRQIADWSAASININGQVALLPAGDPAAGNHPAISHSWGQMNPSATNPDVAMSWYDSGGVDIGRVTVGEFVHVKGGTGGNWITQVDAAPDDTGNEAETLHNYKATTAASATYSVSPEKSHLRLLSFLNEAAAGELVNIENQYRGIVVQDRSEIPTYGAWPNQGVLASDVIAYVLARWAPLINFTTGSHGSLKPSSYPIPQLAFKEWTTAQEVILAALKYELLEWGVWPGPNGSPTFYLNRRGEREGRKRWRARVGPANLESVGNSLSQTRNAMLVSYADPDGTMRWVGPPGSNCRITSEALIDQDPLNPANEAGIKAWGRASLRGIGSPEAAITLGAERLAASKELDGTGKARLTGYVEDEYGQEWPYYHVHGGDLIEFVDASIPGYRYIIDAQRSRSSRSVAIELDAPPDATDVALERDSVALAVLGLS